MTEVKDADTGDGRGVGLCSVRNGAHLLQVVEVEELSQLLVELGLGQRPVVQELHPVRLHLKPNPLLNTSRYSQNSSYHYQIKVANFRKCGIVSSVWPSWFPQTPVISPTLLIQRRQSNTQNTQNLH